MDDDWMDFFQKVENSSLPLKEKLGQLLGRFERLVENEQSSASIPGAVNSMSKFFINNYKDENDDFLINDLKKYFATIWINFSNIFSTIPIKKFEVFLECNQSEPMFQKCDQYWLFYYKFLKQKDPKDVQGFFQRFNEIHNKKRPLVTKALEVLQRMHSRVEEQKCCSKNKETLLFYIDELLTIINSDIVQEALNSDTKFIPIIKNTKLEIARLLKCLYGLKFQSLPCNHATTRCNLNLNTELAEKIMKFYLPKDLDTITDHDDKINDEVFDLLKSHPQFATIYVEKETKITRLISFMNKFIDSVQKNRIGFSTNDVKNFIIVCTRHFKNLTETVIQNVSYINNAQIVYEKSIELYVKLQRWSLIANSKDCSLVLKDLWVLIGNLRTALKNTSNQSNQNAASTDRKSQSIVQISSISQTSQNSLPNAQTPSNSNNTQPTSSNLHNDQSNNSEQEFPINQAEPNQQVHLAIQATSGNESMNEQNEEDRRLEAEIEKQTQKEHQLAQSLSECKKLGDELKMKRMEKKFNNAKTQLESKISELQTKLDKSTNDNLKLVKKNEELAKKDGISMEKIQQLTRENEELRQVLEEKLIEELREEENYLRKKRQHEEEETRLREAKRARRSNISSQFNVNISQENENGSSQN